MPTLTVADLDNALAPFYRRDLVPVVSTNGSIPEADVQVVRVPADQRTKGEANVILDVWITAKGQARRDAVSR